MTSYTIKVFERAAGALETVARGVAEFAFDGPDDGAAIGYATEMRDQQFDRLNHRVGIWDGERLAWMLDFERGQVF